MTSTKNLQRSKTITNITKTSWNFSQRYDLWSFVVLQILIREVLLLVLRLISYIILFVIWWQFQYLKNMMVDVENILNEDEFFADAIDAPQEQRRKRECLKGAKIKSYQEVINSGSMKEFTKLVMKPSTKYILNTTNMN